MTAGGSAWLDHRAGQGGGQAPQGRGWWCPPVGWLLPPADRGRACRSRPERADRARMPGLRWAPGTPSALPPASTHFVIICGSARRKTLAAADANKGGWNSAATPPRRPARPNRPRAAHDH